MVTFFTTIRSAIRHEFSNSKIATIPMQGGEPIFSTVNTKEELLDTVNTKEELLDKGRQLRGLNLLSKIYHLGLVLAVAFRVPRIGHFARQALEQRAITFIGAPLDAKRPDVGQMEAMDSKENEKIAEQATKNAKDFLVPYGQVNNTPFTTWTAPDLNERRAPRLSSFPLPLNGAPF